MAKLQQLQHEVAVVTVVVEGGEDGMGVVDVEQPAGLEEPQHEVVPHDAADPLRSATKPAMS